MLVRQANQKSVILVIIGTFLAIGIKFQQDVRSMCNDLLMTSMNLIDIAILKIRISVDWN